jgi:hypothetical protein
MPTAAGTPESVIFSNGREASNIQQGLPQQKQQQELKTRIRTKNLFDIFVSLYQPECLRGGGMKTQAEHAQGSPAPPSGRLSGACKVSGPPSTATKLAFTCKFIVTNNQILMCNPRVQRRGRGGRSIFFTVYSLFSVQ